MISKKFRKQIKNIERSKRGIKNGLIIVDAATDKSMAYPTVNKKSCSKQIVRHHHTVGIPSYKSAKNIVSDIAKETGVELSPSLVGRSLNGIYPPIGIRKDGKIIKIIKKNGKY